MPRLLALGALALALAACDAAETDAALATAALDDAATAIASAVALDAGGLLEEAASAASLAAPPEAGARHPDPRPGCQAERTYDEATGVWTAVADCERGDPDGRFYATFERTTTYRFLDADGQPLPGREGAASVEVDVLSGSSLFRSPRGVHALDALTSDLTVTDLGQDLVTVAGTVQRAASDTLRGRRGVRTLDYELDATLDGVQGPPGVTRRWRRAVAGTVSGTLVATLTRTPRGGETETVEIDQAFTITFPTDGRGDRVAEIVLGGRRYRADVETGEIAGLSD
ncbi:hypothetical protein [Rubrivirga sp.]|uniref:hypothetical protein n=1 Tax=Rubrivirga sp. TaxID=1885344 RepID=UPI003B52DDBD